MDLIADTFERMSLRQKAFFPFTDEQWKLLSKSQKKRVFFARHKFNVTSTSKGDNE